MNGITTAQEFDLRSKKGLAGLSEKDKWRKMYRIIFPMDANIPSPCKHRLQPVLLRSSTNVRWIIAMTISTKYSCWRV